MGSEIINLFLKDIFSLTFNCILISDIEVNLLYLQHTLFCKTYYSNNTNPK